MGRGHVSFGVWASWAPDSSASVGSASVRQRVGPVAVRSTGFSLRGFWVWCLVGRFVAGGRWQVSRLLHEPEGFAVGSHGSGEFSESCPWMRVRQNLPRSGRPTAVKVCVGEIAAVRRESAVRWAYRSAVVSEGGLPRVDLAPLGRPVAIRGEPFGFGVFGRRSGNQRLALTLDL